MGSLMTGALLLWLDGVSRQAEAERGSSTVAPASQTTSISILRDDIEHTEPTETPAVRSVTEGVMQLAAGTARRSAR